MCAVAPKLDTMFNAGNRFNCVCVCVCVYASSMLVCYPSPVVSISMAIFVTCATGSASIHLTLSSRKVCIIK